MAVILLSGGNAWAHDPPPGPPPGPPCPPMMRDHRPYGGYCDGPRWGRYGARRPVRTEADARSRLDKFFEGQEVTIGTITERGRFFHADILDPKKNVVDRVIIDKRTGRIRSVY